MSTVTTANQVISLVTYLMILVLAVFVWLRWRGFRGLVLFPALWAGMGIVYYAMVLAGRFSTAETLLWGSYHRLMVGLMVLAGMVALVAILMAADKSRDGDDGGDDA